MEVKLKASYPVDSRALSIIVVGPCLDNCEPRDGSEGVPHSSGK